MITARACASKLREKKNWSKLICVTEFISIGSIGCRGDWENHTFDYFFGVVMRISNSCDTQLQWWCCYLLQMKKKLQSKLIVRVTLTHKLVSINWNFKRTKPTKTNMILADGPYGSLPHVRLPTCPTRWQSFWPILYHCSWLFYWLST